MIDVWAHGTMHHTVPGAQASITGVPRNVGRGPAGLGPHQGLTGRPNHVPPRAASTSDARPWRAK
jgi:hypothetical protein